MKVLIRQKHGLGDAVQLTVILKHIKHYHPDWSVDVELTKGKHSVANGLCQSVWIMNEKPAKGHYDQVFNLSWYEPNRAYPNVPSGKPARCLYEVFNLEPIPDLFYYQINVDRDSAQAARKYLETVPQRKGYVFIHYQGNSSSHSKNLSHDDVRHICNYLIENEYTPIILDWDSRSPLIDQRTIFCPDTEKSIWKERPGNATLIAALIEHGSLFIGIDSGPLHVAGSTRTASIGVWTKHHPVNFFDLSHNVIHLLPRNARRNIRGSDKDTAQRYFESKYQFRYYDHLGYSVLKLISSILHTPEPTGNPNSKSYLLNSSAYGEDYYNEHRDAGLDYAAYGSWQQDYCEWIADALQWRNKNVIDVGCACGALVKGMKDKDINAVGTDLNEYCINIGRRNWPELKLHVCDAVNMHLFKDQSFDGIHMMQTAEHIKPDLVPFVLAEMNRIGKMGSLLFSVHDTIELFERNNRMGERDDPTHVCIRSRTWWKKILEMTGWEDVGAFYENALTTHGLSYLKKYDWDWFVFRKIRHFTDK